MPVIALPVLPFLFSWVPAMGVWFVRLLVVSVAAKFIFALGIGLAVFVGAKAFIEQAEAYITMKFLELPPEVSGFVGLLELDTACSLILGAYAWRAAWIALKQLRLVRS